MGITKTAMDFQYHVSSYLSQAPNFSLMICIRAKVAPAVTDLHLCVCSSKISKLLERRRASMPVPKLQEVESKCVWSGKKKSWAVTFEGMWWFLLWESEGHQVSSYIRTFVDYNIHSNHTPIYLLGVALTVPVDFGGVGVIVFRRSSSVMGRQRLRTLAMKEQRTLYLLWQVLICYFTPYH